MAVRTYSMQELRRIVKESVNEFEPKFGSKNLQKDNKSINDKAYKESGTRTKDYDGGARDNHNKNGEFEHPQTDNKGMHDLKYDLISDSFKDRVKSQSKGYVSADAEKKHKDDEFGNADFNEMKGLDGRQKEMKRMEVDSKTNGLTSKELDRRAVSGVTGERVFENKLTTIRFKNTTFITENHMLSKVPDNFKIEGKSFIMKDKVNNEYLVEWGEEPKVTNKSKINEQKNRIHQLFNYERGESTTSSQSRLTEDTKFSDILGKARKLMK
jgi:hypothetical protein